jgi:hypothetical protein
MKYFTTSDLIWLKLLGETLRIFWVKWTLSGLKKGDFCIVQDKRKTITYEHLQYRVQWFWQYVAHGALLEGKNNSKTYFLKNFFSELRNF